MGSNEQFVFLSVFPRWLSQQTHLWQKKMFTSSTSICWRGALRTPANSDLSTVQRYTQSTSMSRVQRNKMSYPI